MSKTVPTSFFVYHNGVRCHGKSMNEPGGVKSKGENTMKDMFRKLQLFAEEGAEGGAGDAEASTAEDQEGTQGDQNGSGEAESGQKPEKKYTDEDVDRIIAKKIAAERKRMSKLFNDEQQESELDKRERDVLKRELRADAKERLASEGLPVALADLINYSDKEESEKSLDEVTATFRAAVAQGVKDALKGNAPRVSTGGRATESDLIRSAFARNAR